MKKYLFLFALFLFVTLDCFADTWTSEKGQKLTFTNLTSIKFKKDSLPKIGEEITRWKNASIVFSINNQGNALCEIVIVPDNYDPLASTEWIAWLYNWFITSIEDSSQQSGFMNLGFFVRFRLNFSRGSIEQYAALKRSGYVKFYDDMHFEAGDYKADSTDMYDWLYPKYNAATKSWNSGYLYKYIIGDFESIKDLPVPAGLDDTFKKAMSEIPNLIRERNWKKFNSLISRYDLKFEKYFDTLLENDAPVSVFSMFSESQKYNFSYKEKLSTIVEKDITLMDYFFQYFSKKEKELLRDLLQSTPDEFIKFFKKHDTKISTLFETIPENIILECSAENIEYVSKDYDILALSKIMSRLDEEKIKIILQNRNDNVANFLRFYYLDFEKEISFEKLSEMADSFSSEISLYQFYCENIFNIEVPIAEKLANEKYSSTLSDLFKNNILKIIVAETTIFSITTDFDKFGVSMHDYEKSSVIKQIISDGTLQVAYELYTEEISIESLFYPNSITKNNCKFSLYFDGGNKYSDSNIKKSGSFLFGELKKGKFVKKIFDFTNSNNENLLFLSLRNGNDKFSQQLIKEGIDISIINSDGQSPLDISKEMGNVKIQKLLEKNLR